MHVCACTRPSAWVPHMHARMHTHRPVSNIYCFFTAKIIRESAAMLRHTYIDPRYLLFLYLVRLMKPKLVATLHRKLCVTVHLQAMLGPKCCAFYSKLRTTPTNTRSAYTTYVSEHTTCISLTKWRHGTSPARVRTGCVNIIRTTLKLHFPLFSSVLEQTLRWHSRGEPQRSR